MPLINRVLHLAAGGGKLPIYTGEYVIYGDEKQGWIEMLTDGTLTMPRALRRRGIDIYMLTQGHAGSEPTYSNEKASAGSGGAGGLYGERFGVEMPESCEVYISGPDSGYEHLWVTAIGEFSVSDDVYGTHGAAGGTGATYTSSGTSTTSKKGGDGRQPFADNSPMSEGFAAKKLGAGGGGGGIVFDKAVKVSPAQGGTYGAGRGGGSVNGDGDMSYLAQKGTANTGSGGGGAGCDDRGETDTELLNRGAAGGCGIAIARWGY